MEKYIVIDENHNQSIRERFACMKEYGDTEFVALIDNSKEFDKYKWTNFEFPLYAEGFKRIELKQDNSDIDGLYSAISQNESFKHNDRYHFHETLKEHNDRIKSLLKDDEMFDDLIVDLHDFGKPLTVKQNPHHEQYLCYYNHEQVGTRAILTYLSTKDIEKFYKALVVCNYHMMQVLNKSKANIFDLLKKDNMFEMIQSFAKADSVMPIAEN